MENNYNKLSFILSLLAVCFCCCCWPLAVALRVQVADDVAPGFEVINLNARGYGYKLVTNILDQADNQNSNVVHNFKSYDSPNHRPSWIPDLGKTDRIINNHAYNNMPAQNALHQPNNDKIRNISNHWNSELKQKSRERDKCYNSFKILGDKIFDITPGGSIVTTNYLSNFTDCKFKLTLRHTTSSRYKSRDRTITINVVTGENVARFVEYSYDGTLLENSPALSLVQSLSDLYAVTGGELENICAFQPLCISSCINGITDETKNKDAPFKNVKADDKDGDKIIKNSFNFNKMKHCKTADVYKNRKVASGSSDFVRDAYWYSIVDGPSHFFEIFQPENNYNDIIYNSNCKSNNNVERKNHHNNRRNNIRINNSNSNNSHNNNNNNDNNNNNNHNRHTSVQSNDNNMHDASNEQMNGINCRPPALIRTLQSSDKFSDTQYMLVVMATPINNNITTNFQTTTCKIWINVKKRNNTSLKFNDKTSKKKSSNHQKDDGTIDSTNANGTNAKELHKLFSTQTHKPPANKQVEKTIIKSKSINNSASIHQPIQQPKKLSNRQPNRKQRSALVKPTNVVHISESAHGDLITINKKYYETLSFKKRPKHAGEGNEGVDWWSPEDFFEIDNFSGVIRLKHGQRLDYESRPVIDFTVVLTTIDDPNCEFDVLNLKI
ncbi:hypothetical protein HELRODRAFT_179303 [Helobdella robusta]|uniref:CUB domain-containing protein n=1 Tax=Helobdella robusta TaxID=6412 RepID=T1FEI6_HELRO|nr:hypothetical protein HELRODRAFT_179303 [Helobdella robusta]ESN95528.1 hypothetical protein HELRODRAFT_179303 [Helobdella robusta]